MGNCWERCCGQWKAGHSQQFTVDEPPLQPSWALPGSVEVPSWLCELQCSACLHKTDLSRAEQLCPRTEVDICHHPGSKRWMGLRTVSLQLVMVTGLQKAWEIRGHSSGGPVVEDYMEIVVKRRMGTAHKGLQGREVKVLTENCCALLLVYRGVQPC